MALICDTGGIYALFDRDDQAHAGAAEVLEQEAGPLLLPVVLLAEIDFLLNKRLGPDAALEFAENLGGDGFQLVSLSEDDLPRCRELLRDYKDLNIGLADATVVATAERLGVFRLLSTDERHFRTIKPRGATHFTLLPADR
jgi:uncharacterized protein